METDTPAPIDALLDYVAIPVEDRPVGLGVPNFARADLRGATLMGVDLRDVDLSEADLSGARLNGSDLRGAMLHGANLEGASLLGANLDGADLSEVRAARATFGAATAANVDLTGADLTHTSWAKASLEHSDLRGAVLKDARLRSADLREVEAHRADFTGADMGDANVLHASFRDADLTSAHLNNLRHPVSADWIGVVLIDVDFTGAYLTRRIIVDQNYLHEFRMQGRRHELIYRVWWLTSDCGRSFGRWAALTMAIAVAFAGIYAFIDIDYGDYPTAISPLYYSLVTMTTLGYGDVLPASGTAQTVALFQVVIGYMMLGGLLGIFGNKMSRRAD